MTPHEQIPDLERPPRASHTDALTAWGWHQDPSDTQATEPRAGSPPSAGRASRRGELGLRPSRLRLRGGWLAMEALWVGQGFRFQGTDRDA
jgi:hypothetical protein